MKKGFTILELLVASMILGIVLLALTSLLNQSQISWRTGVAAVADLAEVRENIAIVRDEADRAVPYEGQLRMLVGVFDDNDQLNHRTWSVGDQSGSSARMISATKPGDIGTVSVGTGGEGTGSKNYIVNVMSCGPDREFGTWDDIWSCPDEFE